MNFKSIFFVVVVVFTLARFTAKAAVTGTNDSIASPTRADVTDERQKQLIENMSEKQLNTLVDHLFDIDTVSPELISTVKVAIDNLNCKKEDSPLFSSSDLYSNWETDELFPEYDKLKVKEDTSYIIVLEHGEHQNYCHPFIGPVTSNYGWRGKTMHKGIDIDLVKGDKVAVAFDGMVRIAKKDAGFGNVVIVRHYNGLETVYAHLSKIKVKPGQLVSAGDIIGLGGSTGHSTGSHLHFEVRLKGVPVNPKSMISFTEQKLIANEFIFRKNKKGLAAYPVNSKFYTVENGDTIFEIAKRFGTSITSLKEMNNIYGKYVYLKPGQEICVAY